MKVIEKGHVYQLDYLDGPNRDTLLTFVNREGNPHEGTTNQEVLRALIDRVHHLESRLPHDVNPKIIHHLRMALVLHEARALERKVEKGLLNPEGVDISLEDGHFQLNLLFN